MKNVVKFKIPEDPSISSKPDFLLDGLEKKQRSPLIEHLAKVADQSDIKAVIELLQDIRAYQDHPDMIRAFRENNQTLAHGVKDHNKNVLELLVEDYLSHNGLDPEKALDEKYAFELETHVRHVALNTLKGYQEVVEGIRMDVSALAEQLESDESIRHISELIGSIQDAQAHPVVRESIRGLPASHPAKQVLYSDSADLHEALAKAAFQEGYRNPEAASKYLKETFHTDIREAFGEALQMAKASERGVSGIFLSDIALERIHRDRQSNPRINAAFSLMEGLKSKLGSGAEEKLKKLLGEDKRLSETMTRVLGDPSGENVEAALAAKTSSIALDLAELSFRVEMLANLYIRSLCEHDYKIQKGMEKISRYRNGDRELREAMETALPEDSRELRFIMENSADIASCVTQLWLEEDFGNIENLDRLLDKIATDAQCYLDSERPPSMIPYSNRPENEATDLVMKKIRFPAFGTAAHNLMQILRAASSNYYSNGELSESVSENPVLVAMLERFSAEGDDFAENIFADYTNRVERDEAGTGSLDDYLEGLLRQVQASCSPETYQKLLRWSERKTIPAAPPPPSVPVPPRRKRGYRETIPIEYMADVMEDRPSRIKLDESALEATKVPYVFEGEKFSTETGQLVKMAYAMEGAMIEVANGSKLDLFMANNNVVVRLLGDNALLRIQKTTRNCERIQLIGKYGEAIVSGANIELGEGVETKLV